MLTRRSRGTVSPSLALNEPAARMGLHSPSLGDDSRPPDNHFRPVASPSLMDIPELMPSPTTTPCGSPSLGLIPREAMFRAATAPPAPGLHNERVSGEQMTTSVCKRASRMARPSEPSEGAKRHAENIVNELERELALDGYVRAVVKQETQTFKHTAPSTGKGPAVRAETGDAESDAAAQAIMNHVSGMPFNTPCGLLLTLRLCLHRWSLSRVVASTRTTWSLPG